MGEMRGVFGVYIAILAVTYGLDVERGLATIVPGADRDDGPSGAMRQLEDHD